MRALALSWMLSGAVAWGACPVGGAAGEGDYLARLFSGLASCPGDVRELKAALTGDGLSLRPSMVANRGFHNPGQGSFSFFERATGRSKTSGLSVADGELFFGHFTGAAGSHLVLDQEPRRGALMVELIAWDPTRGAFQFYELIGDGTRGRWFHRGSSAEILGDVRRLHLSSPPQFGRTLRCSGCHTNGGPIMKELVAPHNDWWTRARPLSFGALTPDNEVGALVSGLSDADDLAVSVRTGVVKLLSDPRHQARLSALTLPEQLRPLFCPVELNLESDPVPSSAASGTIQIPSAFFVDARLAAGSVPVSKAAYASAVAGQGFRFPETALSDADHAWLTPVKAFSDSRFGAGGDEFVADVLAVDLGHPIFSSARCGLLKLVPAAATADWLDRFKGNLRASALPGASVLLANLEDPTRTAAFHRARAAALLAACRARWGGASDLTGPVRLLAQRREEARRSDISKNPLGQILEPGFRVIFPEPSAPAVPGELALDETCSVVRR